MIYANNTITKISTKCKTKSQYFLKIFTDLLSIALIVIILMMIINPARYIDSINNGVRLFFISVFPSLFPFFFFSKLLTGLGTINKISKPFEKFNQKIFNLPAISSYVFIMSVLCGYPVGAKLIGDLYENNQINEIDAKYMVRLCSTSGPIFVIGAVGVNMYNDYLLGSLIFLCHILSSIFLAIIFKPKRKNYTPSKITYKIKSDKNILESSTTGSIMSILTVGVFITIFFMVIDVLYDLKILQFGENIVSRFLTIINIDNNLASGIVSGIIEMTRGLSEISNVSNNSLKLIIGSSLISFGGLSIIMQSLVFLTNTRIKALEFILFKCLQAILTIIIAVVISLAVYGI